MISACSTRFAIDCAGPSCMSRAMRIRSSSMIWKTCRDASRRRAVPFDGPGARGAQIVEAPVDGAEHLLLGADAREPRAQLDLALLGRREVRADLRKRPECAVDLVDVAGRKHAQQRSPARLGRALRGAKLLQARGNSRKLLVQRSRRGVELLDALGHQESDAGQRRRVHGGGCFDFAHQLHHVTAESHPACSSQMAVTGLLHGEPQVAASV